MLSDREIYYGIALISLFENSSKKLSIYKSNKESLSLYEIGSNSNLFIKHSTSRITPWSFSLTIKDKVIISEILDKSQEVYLNLVCGYSGVAVISSQEVMQITDFESNNPSRISIKSFKKESYEVSGKKGKLKHKVSKTKPWDRFQNLL